MFSANDTYLLQGQTPDEMVQLDGSFRPAWAEFMEYWKTTCTSSNNDYVIHLFKLGDIASLDQGL